MELVRDIHKDQRKDTLLAQLTVLEKACFSDPWSEAMLQESLLGENVHLFTAWETDRLVGYLMLMTVPPDGEILNLAVSPDDRRKGIAALLMEDCRAFCLERKVDTLFLEVRASNLPAVALYQSRGFLTVGKRKNYYRYPTEDALVMVKRIEDLSGRDEILR